MATNVIVPTPLRQYANNQRSVSVEGATVGEALAALTAQYPDLGKQLWESDNTLRSFVNVYRNDDDVRYLDGMNTALGDRDELSIIPAIAGGV